MVILLFVFTVRGVQLKVISSVYDCLGLHSLQQKSLWWKTLPMSCWVLSNNWLRQWQRGQQLQWLKAET